MPRAERPDDQRAEEGRPERHDKLQERRLSVSDSADRPQQSEEDRAERERDQSGRSGGRQGEEHESDEQPAHRGSAGAHVVRMVGERVGRSLDEDGSRAETEAAIRPPPRLQGARRLLRLHLVRVGGRDQGTAHRPNGLFPAVSRSRPGQRRRASPGHPRSPGILFDGAGVGVCGAGRLGLGCVHAERYRYAADP